MKVQEAVTGGLTSRPRRVNLAGSRAGLGLLIPAAVCLAAALAPGRSARAQSSGPPAYGEALARLEEGDTAAAVAGLREAVRQAPEFGPAYLRLGALLVDTAHEIETRPGQRLEARSLLERALDLMSHEPEALVEYGLLLRKQHMSVDTRRVLDRALELAEEQGRDLPPRSRARLHFGLAKVYERWWEDWHNAVWAPPTAEPVRCFRQNRGSFADRAVSCPEQLWTHVERHVSIEDERHEERLRMMEHLREALEADPSHVEAAVHLLGHLADAGEWEAYMERAGTLVETAPAHPWAWIFLGLGLHEQAREEAAEGAFQRGLALLPEEGRRVFRDVRPLLTEEAREGFDTLPEPEQAAAREVFYRTKDPVFLTEENERRLEHWSRVAWAELKFGAPASGLPGWETPRGRIWIRYGRPARRFNLGPGQIYWLYGPRGPVFVFEKTRTYRRTWMTDLTFEYAEDLESTAPEHYRPRTVSALHPLPHQRVRFRGSRPELTRVEIYARPPLDSLAVAEGAPLEAGVFVFDGAFEPVWERRHHAFATEDGLLLTYRFELPRGAYHYGLEARLEAGSAVSRPLARARERLTTTAYPRGTLALSDLLLARRIVPRTETPRSREELVIDPSRTLRFQPGEPVHMYFEVYGLDTDASGLGRYRARLAVEDSTRQNVVERIVSAFLPNLIRPEGGQPWVSWERGVEPSDDRAIDFLAVELPELDEGEYAVRLRVTDLATGETAETVRMFRVGEPPEEERPPLETPPGG